MKRILSLIFVSIVLLSLCACGKNSNQEAYPSTSPSQTATDNTEEPTDGTTEGTQAPTEEPTTTPTEEPTTVPTETPTTKPTETPVTKPTTCSHSYKDATCTTPKTCPKCGVTSGSALGHSYKDATCTAPKTCSKCGATSGSAAGHSWKDATCTTPKTCSICKKTDGTKAEHSYADGKCSFCGKADIVNPQEYFTPTNYVSLEKRGQELSVVELIWNGETYDYFESLYIKTDGDPNNFIDYEGERYYLCGGGGPPLTYRLTDTYIEFIDPGNEPCAKYVLQHDGSLRLITHAEGWVFSSLFYKGTLNELLSKLK